jgi:hypothetical protein
MKMLDMFKDDVTKQFSFGRISAAIVLVFQIGYAGYIVFTTKTMPDLQPGWAGLILVAYGINKMASAFSPTQPGDAMP